MLRLFLWLDWVEAAVLWNASQATRPKGLVALSGVAQEFFQLGEFFFHQLAGLGFQVQAQQSAQLHLALRRNGVVTIPSGWGRIFVSFSHSAEDCSFVTDAYRKAAHTLETSRSQR